MNCRKCSQRVVAKLRWRVKRDGGVVLVALGACGHVLRRYTDRQAAGLEPWKLPARPGVQTRFLY